MSRSPLRRRALTLIEMLVVLTVLVALAGLLVPLLSDSVGESKETVTRSNMKQLRDIVMGQYRLDMNRQLPRPGTKGKADGRLDKPQLRYLFINPTLNPESATSSFNPDTRLGWRGPYLMASAGTYVIAGSFTKDFGETGDPTILDGWSNPIVIVEAVGQAELRSAGADGILSNSDDIVLSLY